MTKDEIQNAWENNFFDVAYVGPTMAVTLTLKQAIGDQQTGIYEYLDYEKASRNNHHFLRKINYDIYKNAFKRYNKRLIVIPSIECGTISPSSMNPVKRLHVHMLLQMPDPNRCSSKHFEHLIRTRWSETRWGYAHVHFKQAYDANGWLKYLVKEGGDAVDLNNVYLG